MLAVMDLNPAAASRFVTEHADAVAVADVRDLHDADIAITMLPDSNAVEAIVLGSSGEPGLRELLKRGATATGTSSSEPVLTWLAKTLPVHTSAGCVFGKWLAIAAIKEKQGSWGDGNACAKTGAANKPREAEAINSSSDSFDHSSMRR